MHCYYCYYFYYFIRYNSFSCSQHNSFLCKMKKRKPKTGETTLHAEHETNCRIIDDEQFHLSVCCLLQFRRFLSFSSLSSESYLLRFFYTWSSRFMISALFLSPSTLLSNLAYYLLFAIFTGSTSCWS